MTFESSLIASRSKSLILALVTIPATILPLTFVAVRAISINGSTEITKPTMATGKFIAPKTINEANVAPPPTPATPNELIVTIATNIKIKPILKTSIPAAGATIVASIAGYTPAQPFCPIDKPKLAEKFAVASSTPNALVCVSIFNGNAPALEREVKAKLNTGKAFLKLNRKFTM